MKVLTLRPGDVVAIGESIRITVSRIKRRDAVSLAVTAPPCTPIRRDDFAGTPQVFPHEWREEVNGRVCKLCGRREGPEQ